MILREGVKQSELTELNGFPSRSIHRYRLLLTPRMAMRSLVSAFSEITPAGDRDIYHVVTPALPHLNCVHEREANLL